jgi:hypothetical protein
MTIIAKPWPKKFMMIGQSLVDIKRKKMRENKEGKNEKEREEKK